MQELNEQDVLGILKYQAIDTAVYVLILDVPVYWYTENIYEFNVLEEYPVEQVDYQHVIVKPKLLLLNVPLLAVQENIKLAVKAFAKFKLKA